MIALLDTLATLLFVSLVVLCVVGLSVWSGECDTDRRMGGRGSAASAPFSFSPAPQAAGWPPTHYQIFRPSGSPPGFMISTSSGSNRHL